jgi:hypothetical protein
MSHFVAGILRIILLEASACLLVLERVIDVAAVPLRARRRWASYAVAALSVYAFVNFGELHGDGRLVHPWEQYHFFLGSKYLREVGYFDLYRATLLADRDGPHRLDRVTRTRDLHTFDLVDVDRALADGAAVRARFTDARWDAFKSDWASLSRWPAPWNDIVADHGNSGSPAWAVVALPFVELFGCSPAGQTALGALDLVLVALLFVFLVRAYGAEAGAVGLVIFCLTPFTFDYLAGSILRWDWLFAVGMAFACQRRGRPALAGAFLGYAIASKLFPLFFAAALGLWLVVDTVRRRRLHPHLLRFAAGATAAAVIAVAASSAAFGTSAWRGYGERIAVTQAEKYYPNQYSLRTVFLQLVESTPHEIATGLFKPAVIKQSLPRVSADADRPGLVAVQIALTAAALVAIARGGAEEALAAGPFLVFIWLTVNAYYWNMLGLTALVWAGAQLERRRLSVPLVGVHAIWGAYYLYQHLDMGFAEGYFVALLLLGLLVVWATSLISRRRVLGSAA